MHFSLACADMTNLPRAAAVVDAVDDSYYHNVDLCRYGRAHDRNNFVNLHVTIELDVE